MKILRASDYKRMPWKNGKGETAEIAVFPPDASIETFDCRISMAAVVEDGAFSTFDNVDRTLIVLDGEGIVLSVEGSDQVELRPDSPPHSFAADAPTTATLLGGPITDLNIMTRRGKSEYSVRRQTAKPVQADDEGVTLVFALDECTEGGRPMLARKDSIILEPGELVALDLNDNAAILVIEVH